jgi:site-specific recombinase XerD
MRLPKPLLDTLAHLPGQQASADWAFTEDFTQSKAFLLSYDGSEATFNAYRREVERLLQWSWLIAEKSIKDIRRADIESYLSFCQSPPLAWINTKKAPRFMDKEGIRIPNPEWRPFVATVSKAAHRKGQAPQPKNYELSQTALKEIFAILSSFYNFLIQEDYTEVNPLLQIRQKSKYFQKRQGKPKIRRLSELQWHFVIETAERMAKEQPEPHQRTLFMMTALYAMYLRISELTASARWTPKMNDFHRDHDGLWWFTTVGKGNKERTISVSDAMLKALSDYRKFLGLSPLPSPADNSPLLPKVKGKGPITSATYSRKVVQGCFDAAIEQLKNDGHIEEAESLLEATVHWLRHTGISDDVKRRPREHVRDDAGHSSGAITDNYIDVGLRERHASARKKPLKED